MTVFDYSIDERASFSIRKCRNIFANLFNRARITECSRLLVIEVQAFLYSVTDQRESALHPICRFE